jgi:hypothetical protein
MQMLVIEDGRDQGVLALKMIIERALGHARPLRNPIDADPRKAVAIEKFVGRFENALPRRFA